MTTKQHRHKIHNHSKHIRDPFANFIEKELEKSLIELVNTNSWSRSYIALGRIRTITRLIDASQNYDGRKYNQIISVTFRRMR